MASDLFGIIIRTSTLLRAAVFNAVRIGCGGIKYGEVINTLWNDLSDKNHKVTIVFAPACASFDQFENFEKRGAYFNQLILNKLKK